MAYTTDGTANFNFFINRQGPRGPQGEQGPEGFSPNVTVEEDEGNTYTLRVTNKDSYFVTPNLREHKVDKGGTYVRWDRQTEELYLGDPNTASTEQAGEIRIATESDLTNQSETTAVTPKQLIGNITSAKDELQADIDANTQLIDTYRAQMVDLTSDQTVSGNKKIIDLTIARVYSSVQNKLIMTANSDSMNIGTNLQVGGVIRNANGIVLDDSRLGGTLVQNSATEKYDVRTATDSQTGIVKPDGTSITIDSAGVISATAQEPDIATTEVAGIVKPDGNTITITEDGTISSIAQGDVTAAGDNTFTGKNTFSNTVHFGSSLIADGTVFYLGRAANDTVLYCNDQQTRLASENRITVILGTKIRDGARNIILSQANIEAGDNITIDKTTEGIKISSTASGGAEIDDTTAATDKVYSSSKVQELVNEVDDTVARLATELSNALNTITALENRIQALENLVDGGNAGSNYPTEVKTNSDITVLGQDLSETGKVNIEEINITEE